MKPIFFFKPSHFSIWLLFLSSLFICSCSDNCLEDTIDRFKSEQEGCTNAKIIKFSFQDKEVYAFVEGICFSDASTQVTDENCDLICTLGSIAGLTECNGVDFAQNSEQIEVIWED